MLASPNFEATQLKWIGDYLPVLRTELSPHNYCHSRFMCFHGCAEMCLEGLQFCGQIDARHPQMEGITGPQATVSLPAPAK